MKDKQDWVPDTELDGFETLPVITYKQGKTAFSATLVRASQQPAKPRCTLLYVHGLTDYFFQEHLARACLAEDIAFYAIDLHGFGRSKKSGYRPNYCESVDEYFPELDQAVALVSQSSPAKLLVNAHSTGGLILSLYAHRGKNRQLIDGLCLNSPFLDFPLHGIERISLAVLTVIGRWWPHLSYHHGKPSLYAQSIHKNYRGEWDYNLSFKPLEGFPLYCGWFRAIYLAQKEVQRGLNIECPVLLLHSNRSVRGMGEWRDELQMADAVLDVEHMRRYGPGLGRFVSLVEVENGMHDLMLSAAAVRKQVLKHLFAWVGQLTGPGET